MRVNLIQRWPDILKKKSQFLKKVHNNLVNVKIQNSRIVPLHTKKVKNSYVFI